MGWAARAVWAVRLLPAAGSRDSDLPGVYPLKNSDQALSTEFGSWRYFSYISSTSQSLEPKAASGFD